MTDANAVTLSLQDFAPSGVAHELTAGNGYSISARAGSNGLIGVNLSAYPRGAFVLVQGAGEGGADLVSTIASGGFLNDTIRTSVDNADVYIYGDDTAALQSAINVAASVGGATIDLGIGKSYAVSMLDFDDSSGIILEGHRGPSYRLGATILLTGNADILIRARSTKGLTLSGVRFVQARKDHVGVLINNGHGVSGADSGDLTVSDCEFVGNAFATARAFVELQDCIETRIFRTDFIRATRHIHRVGYANQIAIEHCTFDHASIGAICFPGEKWKVESCTYQPSGMTAPFVKCSSPTGAAEAYSLNISDCWVGDRGVENGVSYEIYGIGVSIKECFTVDGGANSVGILIHGGSEHVTIAGGRIAAPIGIDIVGNAQGNAEAVSVLGVSISSTTATIRGWDTACDGFVCIGTNGSGGAAYMLTLTQGAKLHGLYTFENGLQAKGLGQIPDAPGVYYGGGFDAFPAADDKAGAAVGFLNAGTGLPAGSLGWFTGGKSDAAELVGVHTKSGKTLIRIGLQTVNGNASLRILWRNDGVQTDAQVSVGAIDSGGVGYRILKVPN